MNEDQLKRACTRALRKENLTSLWHYCPTDHFYSGIPDIILCVHGRFGAVELKAAKGKLSSIQNHTLDRIKRAGGSVAVCRSVEEFVKFLRCLLEASQRTKGDKHGADS